MEEELRKQLESSLAQERDAALQCFDATGLPLLTVGKCPLQASNVLSSIYRHALLVTDSEGEKPPLVIFEREKRFAVSSYCKPGLDGSIWRLHNYRLQDQSYLALFPLSFLDDCLLALPYIVQYIYTYCI
uniref:Late endosomal/lysosomal adaptor and MAPK and MTOR activator 5 n=1 Tax=Echinococcus canadensis TaxID=519352 RepID=A0A915EZ69_9CEST